MDHHPGWEVHEEFGLFLSVRSIGEVRALLGLGFELWQVAMALLRCTRECRLIT